jgi:dTDP-4-amino-4,6-dideoxygalactose transaminase
MPSLEEFIPYLEKIWSTKVLTNNGPFHQELEQALCEFLEVENISLFSNGTIALIVALQSLRIAGEVITTPYSFVATAHSLIWNGIRPVFVDIDRETFNLDPNLIEAAITPQTTAIMPVHCYGNPADVEKIQQIADKYGLKIIYDAAHAFGVRYKEESLLKHGDISVLSFHATKVFHTFEGGAIVCSDPQLKKRIDYLKNFGFSSEITVDAPGINGKMSEINAAFGLIHLKHIHEVLTDRIHVDRTYRNELAGIQGITIPSLVAASEGNGSYFPILIDPSYPLSRDQIYDLLKKNGFYGRRYFYPLISNFPMYQGFQSSNRSNLPNANLIADRILCLPIYPSLDANDQQKIIKIISDPLKF